MTLERVYDTYDLDASKIPGGESSGQALAEGKPDQVGKVWDMVATDNK